MEDYAVIDAIASEMWAIVASDDEHTWEWCIKNAPGAASAMRERARKAIVKGGLVSVKRPLVEPTPLDMGLKNALLNHDDST